MNIHFYSLHLDTPWISSIIKNIFHPLSYFLSKYKISFVLAMFEQEKLIFLPFRENFSKALCSKYIS